MPQSTINPFEMTLHRKIPDTGEMWWLKTRHVKEINTETYYIFKKS